MSQVLQELQGAVTSAAERVGPAVVGLGRGWGRGSGVVITAGQVLTNAHVLRGDEVTVRFQGSDEEGAGQVAGVDAELDVALIRVDTGEIEPVDWQPEALGALGPGSPVFALANPGGRGLRVTFGLVSATGRSFRGPRGRRIGGSIEHTAPLPRGSSGGPLVDADGRLLGLNTIRLEGGLILALPADEALQRRSSRLAAGQATERPRLGIALAPPRAARRLRGAVGLPERDGLLVRRVASDSPAERAGIQRGDLLVAAAGRALTGVDELFDALDASDPGATLSLGIVRGTDESEVSVHFDGGR